MIKSLYRFLSPKFQSVHLDYAIEPQPRYGHGSPPHKELYHIIDSQRGNYRHSLQELLKFKENIQEIKWSFENSSDLLPTWDNGFLPGYDIATLYYILANHNPLKYIEVGSGTSTKVAYKAKNDHNLSTEIISIDPQPRSEIDKLADVINRNPFENIDHEQILSLESGDVLFIDNSHRILPNSDSMVFYLEILPRLKSGVLVHIHDIYLPYDYPQFMCDRYYSEQYGLAIALISNPKRYQPVLPNYFIAEDPELSKILDPIWAGEKFADVERHGGSFWIRII